MYCFLAVSCKKKKIILNGKFKETSHVLLCISEEISVEYVEVYGSHMTKYNLVIHSICY